MSQRGVTFELCSLVDLAKLLHYFRNSSRSKTRDKGVADVGHANELKRIRSSSSKIEAISLKSSDGKRNACKGCNR